MRDMNACALMNAGRVKRMYGSKSYQLCRVNFQRKRAFHPQRIETQAPLFLSSARMLINNCQFVGSARRNRKTVRYHGVTRYEG